MSNPGYKQRNQKHYNTESLHYEVRLKRLGLMHLKSDLTETFKIIYKY